jgi:MinD superfamily P-loop ATPase
VRIAVASGKGGTGKTTLATSLAIALARQYPDHPERILLRDCDVETPNAHLYLKPRFDVRVDVGPPVPSVDEDLCTWCGRCEDVCEYNAISVLEEEVLVFSDLCHGCGLCSTLCPEKAISETPRILGVIEAGPTPFGPRLAHGLLHTGEAQAIPVIRGLKQWDTYSAGGGDEIGTDHREPEHIVIDCPPGTTCPVVESMRGADAALLITEPTPFGLHDLELITEVVRTLGLPAAVIVNRDGTGYRRIEEFCDRAGLPIILRIPFSRAIAEGTARGRPLIEFEPDYADILTDLPARLAATPEMSGT